ncbi:MAG TPA: NAD(P)H-dependent oxidoreductase [Candidatus Omnitrophota bacterium]|nr:NAD(P)H-dependent oxidoreductase [Candidatus Omnitrophota bacterium]HPS36966.1 NAD(P)H-dependent oxidoreductase [Candidatus Omnitrophota bacterium]
MNYLIVYTHPNPKSFNHAIRETVVETLKKKNQTVRVRDLYALRFDPVLSASDFETFLAGKTPADIAIEQEHVRWADVLVFIYPVWWGRLPAAACGYFDRVLIKGFAYDYTATGPVGLLPGKKVFCFSTMGAPLAVAESSGGIKSMEQIIDNETFKFCGMEMIGHKYFGSVPTVTDAERKKMLAEVAQIAASWPA